MPPSTRKVAPFTYEDSSDARKSAARAISARLRQPSHRHVDQAPRARGGLAQQILEQRRVDRAGAQRVGADPAPRVLDRDLARHREHAALARRVGDLRGRRAHHRHEGRGVDDRAAARAQQRRDPVLAAEEDALQVHAHHLVEDVLGRVDRRAVRGREDAGVVEEHVQPRRSARSASATAASTCVATATSTLTKQRAPAGRLDRGRPSRARPRPRDRRPPRWRPRPRRAAPPRARSRCRRP